MADWPCRRRRAAVSCLVMSGIVLAGVGCGSARADSIAWATQGPFETCLEASLDKWLQVEAALIVDEDPAAGRLNDAVVAKWTLETVAECRARNGTGDARSEDRFTTYMARWRNHIYDLASSIRQRGASD